MEYQDAWAHYYQGKSNEALKLIDKYLKMDTHDSHYKDRWCVMLSAIYFDQARYQEVLNITSKVRSRIEKAYYEVAKDNKSISEGEKQDIVFIYYKMIGTNGSANYHLGNWAPALKDLLVYVKENPSATFYDIIAVCYYRCKEYIESLEYFKRSFNLHEDDEFKDYAAYNIGALNAILGNVEQAIFWLTIPISHDKELWIKKIKADKDFDPIRNDKRFKEFLK